MEIQELFKVMVEKEASDLYLTVARPPMYRIDGKIQPIGDHQFTPPELETLVKSVMSENQLRDYGKDLELNMAMSLPGVSRFRVNVFRQRGSAGMVIRRVKAEVSSLAELGLPDILKEITMSKRGLVLVVGATGSGKSTTLAAMVDHRNGIGPHHYHRRSNRIRSPAQEIHRDSARSWVRHPLVSGRS
jgi:twitching motility protein PilU